MKVQDLIDLLSVVDPDSEVIIDGCDCSQEASAVFDHSDKVHITRADVEYVHPAAQRVQVALDQRMCTTERRVVRVAGVTHD